MDIMSDEISFIDDLCSKIEPSTKAYLLNSLAYYPLRHLWNSFEKQELATTDILLLLLVILFNIHSDETLMKLIFSMFYQRRILK